MYPVLTYSRTPGDFQHDLATLQQLGLKAIRLIYKGLTEEQFRQRLEEIQRRIREQELDLDILVDLPGKKPIVGDLQQGLMIKAGEEYYLSAEEAKQPLPGISTSNFFDHTRFPELAPGDIISIADDELNMVVKECTATMVRCEALNTFLLTSNRSLSVKNKAFEVAANAAKDLLFVQGLTDLPANLKLVVSFTRTAGDLQHLQLLHPTADLVPKIETIIDEAELLAIFDCCQTIMLGRGDLSLACKPNELFGFQQHLIDLCRIHDKQLIIGTGLLSGIGDKGYPSIAEVADYGYLRRQGVEGFLLTGANAQLQPVKTLVFMQEFEL